MQINTFLPLFHPMPYNQKILTINFVNTIHSKLSYDILCRYSQTMRIHHFMKQSNKHKVISVLYNDKQLFFNFSNYDYSKYEDSYSKYYNLMKHYLHTVKHDVLYNRYSIPEHIVSILYDYRYIKGSKGKKHLVPYQTISSTHIKPIQYFQLQDKFFKPYDELNSIKKLLRMKRKNNKRVYLDKIINILLFKKQLYFQYLDIELIRNICKYF